MGKNLWAAAGMSVVLWNPTNEDFDMQYAGRSFTLESGQKATVNDACANHLLNAFGPRGLTFLSYGDDEKDIEIKAKERNYEFKKRQVQVYNQTNEQRKLTRLGYLPPSKKLKEYALELGIELIEPYSMKDEERAAISKSTVENELLKAQAAQQAKEITELKEMMKQLMSEKEPKKRMGNPNWLAAADKRREEKGESE